IRTDETVGVRAKAMHVAIAIGNSTIAHDVGDLMQCFGKPRPEIPIVVGAAHIGPRIALHRMVEVWKLERIAEEEHWRVVTNKIPVALLGVELQSETTNVPLGIGGTALAGHSGETSEQGCALADLGEDGRFGVFGDVMSNNELTERP